MSTAASTRYTAADITVLEGLDPVRKRPSMYIGGVDSKGLHHLVWEIVDNAVDEYLNGYADTISVTLHKNGDAVTVADNGRGIPVDMHPKHKRPALELILCTLHAGGKFGDTEAYFHSGGLHGVGSSVVNALSKKLVATIRRDGFEWKQTFKRGRPATQLEKIGPFRGHGTIIYFEPDPDIFKTTHFDPDAIKAHLEDMSYIHSGLKITFKNEVSGETFELTHPGGIPEFLQRLVTDHQKPAVTEQPFTLARDNGDKMEVALQWTEATDEVDSLLRQWHPHQLRRHARKRLQEGDRQGDPQLHRDARDQDQGAGDHRRGHPRGDDRHSVDLRSRTAVPGTDQGTA